MKKAKEKPFRDFVLCEVNHLKPSEAFNFESGSKIKSIKETARYKILIRQIFAMQAIEAETKPGDIVMIESPEEWTHDDFLKHYAGNVHEPYWDAIINEYLNFYHNIAKYASDTGRIAMSLESGTHNPKSRIIQAFIKNPDNPRIKYLTTIRRDQGFFSRINAKKPKLVIAAYGHVVSIESKMKPRKVVWFESRPWLMKKIFLLRRWLKRREYYREKAQRLKATRKKLRQKKK